VVVDALGDSRWQALRQSARDLRLHTLSHLDHYLSVLEQQVTKAGGTVHWARDAAEGREIVLELARQRGVRSIVKSKSMITEEIGLNHALEDVGVRVVETDLGEYIIQLAGIDPSHIIAPAVHLSKEEIAQLLTEKLGIEVPPDPKAITEIARERLRSEFLTADMGISGANFLVAETGTLVILTNEGNGRMSTTLPPVHVVVTTIDKVIPDWETLTVLLKLLARSGTGQKMTTYTSFITGPRRSDGENGPREFHLVLIDNGRSRMLSDELGRQMLLCIRCGACQNICPVYNHVGGYAFGWVYAGPLGEMLATQLLGTEIAGDLPFASTLCGACADICPMKIPIPDILLHLRRRVVEGDEQAAAVAPWTVRAGAAGGAVALGTPWLYQAGSQALRTLSGPLSRGEWIESLPSPASRWTAVRPFPAFRADFRNSWKIRPSRREEPGPGVD
jgi:L-lactate dehydrogenase complex protein LldF